VIEVVNMQLVDTDPYFERILGLTAPPNGNSRSSSFGYEAGGFLRTLGLILVLLVLGALILFVLNMVRRCGKRKLWVGDKM